MTDIYGSVKGNIYKGLLKWIGNPIKARMQITRKLQEFSGEIGMALFISTMHKNENLQKFFLKAMKTWINAHIAFVGLPCIYSLFLDEIKQTHFLDAYFSQFKSYQYLKHLTPEQLKESEKTEIDKSLWDMLCEIFYIDEFKDAFDDLVAKPFQMLIASAHKIAQMISIDLTNPQQIIDFINQHYILDHNEIINNIPSKQLAILINPLIHLDFAIIKCNIALYYAYNHLFTLHALKYAPRPYLQYGTTKLLYIKSEDEEEVLAKFFQPESDVVIVKLRKDFLDRFKSWQIIPLQIWHENVRSDIFYFSKAMKLDNPTIIETWEQIIVATFPLQIEEPWESSEEIELTPTTTFPLQIEEPWESSEEIELTPTTTFPLQIEEPWES